MRPAFELLDCDEDAAFGRVNVINGADQPALFAKFLPRSGRFMAQLPVTAKLLRGILRQVHHLRETAYVAAA